MKRLIIYIFAFLLLLSGLSAKIFYKTELFKKNILPRVVTTGNNVLSMNNSFVSNEKNKDEKMIYAKVDLKKDTEYLVESDLHVVGGEKDTFYLIIDFVAPHCDKEEHEHKITIDRKRNSKNIFSIIDSGNLSGEALFRVFHYYNGFVEIKNLRLCEISSTATMLHKSGFYLLFCFGILIAFQLFGFRSEVYNSLKRLIRKVNNASAIRYSENSAILWLVCLYFVSVTIRFALSIMMEVPLIASDESNYKNMAYGFFKTGGFYSTEQYFEIVDIPNILYPWFISFCFYFKDNYYIAIKLLNSLVINLSVFPFYFIAKEFSGEKKALVSSIVILMLPAMNYVNFAMVESLYFTIYSFCFLFVYKSLTDVKSRYRIFAGFFLALLLLTKPNAVAFLLSFAVVTFLLLFYYRRSKTDFFRVLSASIHTVGFFFIAFAVMSLLLKGNLTYDIGLYDQVVDRSLSETIFSAPFMLMLLAHFSTFLNIYCLPFFISVWAFYHFYTEKDHSKLIFLLLGFSLFAMKLAMTFKFTLDISDAENFKRLHARYYFMTFPFFIISFVCFCDRFRIVGLKKIILTVSLIAVLTANLFYFYPEYASHGLLIVDNPDLAWFRVAGKEGLLVLSILYVFIAIWYTKSTNRRYLTYIPFLVIFCLLSNYGEVRSSLIADANNKSVFNRHIPFIQSRIKDMNSNVALIDSNWAYRLHTAFRLPYRYTIVHDLPGGSKITRNMIPVETEYLVLFDNYDLDSYFSSWRKSVDDGYWILHMAME